MMKQTLKRTFAALTAFTLTAGYGGFTDAVPQMLQSAQIMSASASTTNKLTLSGYNNTTYKFDTVDITADSFSVKTVNIKAVSSSAASTTYITLPGLTTGDTAIWSLDKKSVTVIFATEKDKDGIISFLKDVTFESGTTQVDVTVDGNNTVLTNVGDAKLMSSVHEDGTVHYYMYVPVTISSENPNSWATAYNAAKNLRFMGMTGYLATITSERENEVLRTISINGAWSGGSRLNKSIFGTTWDTGTLSIPASPTYTEGFHWCCGPEAGLTYYLAESAMKSYANVGDSKDYARNFLEKSAFYDSETITYDMLWDHTWRNTEDLSEVVGKANEPNNTDSGEPYMQVNYSSRRLWNDKPLNPNRSSTDVKGYFVEFGGYTPSKNNATIQCNTENGDPGTQSPALNLTARAVIQSGYAYESDDLSNPYKTLVSVDSSLDPIVIDEKVEHIADGAFTNAKDTAEILNNSNVAITDENKAAMGVGNRGIYYALTLPSGVTISTPEIGNTSITTLNGVNYCKPGTTVTLSGLASFPVEISSRPAGLSGSTFTMQSAPQVISYSLSALTLDNTENPLITEPNTDFSMSVTDSGGVTYRWYSCNDEYGNSAQVISGENSATYTVTGGKTCGIYYYYCEATCGGRKVKSPVVEVQVIKTTNENGYTYKTNNGNDYDTLVSVDSHANEIVIKEDVWKIDDNAFANANGAAKIFNQSNVEITDAMAKRKTGKDLKTPREVYATIEQWELGLTITPAATQISDVDYYRSGTTYTLSKPPLTVTGFTLSGSVNAIPGNTLSMGSTRQYVYEAEFALDPPAVLAATVSAKPKTDFTLGVTPVPGVTYQWYTCDQNGDNQVLITEATGASLTQQIPEVGTYYYCCKASYDEYYRDYLMTHCQSKCNTYSKKT